MSECDMPQDQSRTAGATAAGATALGVSATVETGGRPGPTLGVLWLCAATRPPHAVKATAANAIKNVHADRIEPSKCIFKLSENRASRNSSA
jgi:hypothetical protein